MGAMNDPNAKGFVSSGRAMSKEDIMGRVRDEDKDAGESVSRQMHADHVWRLLSPINLHIMCPASLHIHIFLHTTFHSFLKQSTLDVFIIRQNE